MFAAIREECSWYGDASCDAVGQLGLYRNTDAKQICMCVQQTQCYVNSGGGTVEEEGDKQSGQPADCDNTAPLQDWATVSSLCGNSKSILEGNCKIGKQTTGL